MRVALIAIILIILAVVGYFVWTTAYEDGEFHFEKLAEFTFPWEKESSETATEHAPATTQAEKPEVTGIIPPTFDIVRIDRQGSAVVAGRGEPGATIRLYSNGELLAETTTNNLGDWTVYVDAPLEEGDQEMTLEMVLEDGSVLKSEQVVVITVPNRPDLKPLVVLGDEDGSSRILQDPVGVRVGDLSLDIVDYDESGAIILQGRAKENMLVRAYVDNRLIGEATADEKGFWEIKPDQSVSPGIYTLRVDQLNENGKVTARVEVPFERTAEEKLRNMKPGQVIVQPGNSLWRISRRLYGRGILYTVIYEANQDQIRDPDLIYPGQVFDTPQIPQ